MRVHVYLPTAYTAAVCCTHIGEVRVTVRYINPERLTTAHTCRACSRTDTLRAGAPRWGTRAAAWPPRLVLGEQPRSQPAAC